MSVKETEGNTQIPTVEDEDLGKGIKVFQISDLGGWPYIGYLAEYPA